MLACWPNLICFLVDVLRPLILSQQQRADAASKQGTTYYVKYGAAVRLVLLHERLCMHGSEASSLVESMSVSFAGSRLSA